jgi:hypothetical protein
MGGRLVLARSAMEVAVGMLLFSAACLAVNAIATAVVDSLPR